MKKYLMFMGGSKNSVFRTTIGHPDCIGSKNSSLKGGFALFSIVTMLKKRVFGIALILIFALSLKINSQDATNDNIKKNENIDAQIKKVKNGWDYYNEGRYYDSIRALLDEKKYYPERVNIYVILGWDYLNLKDYESMEKISLEGLKLNPDDLRIIKNLCEAYVFQKKYNEAVGYLEKYVSLRYNYDEPYLATIYYYLGVCFYNIGYYRKADISLSTALYYNPSDVNVIIQSAENLIKLAQSEKAKTLFNSALKIQPNNIQALDGLKRLENIQK